MTILSAVSATIDSIVASTLAPNLSTSSLEDVALYFHPLSSTSEDNNFPSIILRHCLSPSPRFDSDLETAAIGFGFGIGISFAIYFLLITKHLDFLRKQHFRTIAATHRPPMYNCLHVDTDIRSLLGEDTWSNGERKISLNFGQSHPLACDPWSVFAFNNRRFITLVLTSLSEFINSLIQCILVASEKSKYTHSYPNFISYPFN